jgi:glycosyltransferase involved in cell wall biosynthesis
MKSALVHDYFTQLGKAEKIAEEIYCILPDASLFATVAFPQCMPARLKHTNVHTSWLQSLPQIERYYRLYFLLNPLGVSSIDLSEYDLVISSSSSYAKGVNASRDAIHVCYCHTPMRWMWRYDDHSQRESFGRSQGLLSRTLIRKLKHWDEALSRQPDHFIANSKIGAERIKKCYGRCAEVIHPPINTDRFRRSPEREDYYVVLSRLVPYKRIDLAVQACTELRRKLLVIGAGPDRERLESMAGPTVAFMGYTSDERVEHYLSRCRALLFPGEEDFGMAPLEVAAAGRPTIAYRAGGALETVIENTTGIFFDEQTPEHLAEAIERFERQEWSPDLIRLHSEGFSAENFQHRFRSFLRRIGAPLPAKSDTMVSQCEPPLIEAEYDSINLHHALPNPDTLVLANKRY